MKRIGLGTELSLVFAFIVAVTVFLVSILSGTFINRQFEEYVKKNQKEQADALAENIGSNFNEKKGGWNKAQIRTGHVSMLPEAVLPENLQRPQRLQR